MHMEHILPKSWLTFNRLLIYVGSFMRCLGVAFGVEGTRPPASQSDKEAEASTRWQWILQGSHGAPFIAQVNCRNLRWFSNLIGGVGEIDIRYYGCTQWISFCWLGSPAELAVTFTYPFPYGCLAFRPHIASDCLSTSLSQRTGDQKSKRVRQQLMRQIHSIPSAFRLRDRVPHTGTSAGAQAFRCVPRKVC